MSTLIPLCETEKLIDSSREQEGTTPLDATTPWSRSRLSRFSLEKASRRPSMTATCPDPSSSVSSKNLAGLAMLASRACFPTVQRTTARARTIWATPAAAASQATTASLVPMLRSFATATLPAQLFDLSQSLTSYSSLLRTPFPSRPSCVETRREPSSGPAHHLHPNQTTFPCDDMKISRVPLRHGQLAVARRCQSCSRQLDEIQRKAAHRHDDGRLPEECRRQDKGEICGTKRSQHPLASRRVARN